MFLTFGNNRFLVFANVNFGGIGTDGWGEKAAAQLEADVKAGASGLKIFKNFTSYKGKFTPTICYESIYGEYVSSFNTLGSSWICIITNDGWWGTTFGHQQHQSYARLRAIENRKYVLRSANTGISSVINPLGLVEQFLPYAEEGIIETRISKFDKTTFYAQHGDYIGRLASFLAIIYLLQLLISYLKKQ